MRELFECPFKFRTAQFTIACKNEYNVYEGINNKLDLTFQALKTNLLPHAHPFKKSCIEHCIKQLANVVRDI